MTPIHIPRAPKRTKMPKNKEIDISTLEVKTVPLTTLDTFKTYYDIVTEHAIYRSNNLSLACILWAEDRIKISKPEMQILFITQYTNGIPLTIGDY